MSFKFPADPADGTVIVNGNKLGTYDEATNTWVVSEIPISPGVPGPVGPKGKKGDQGDPGAGVDVYGSVESFSDLPPYPLQNTFWVVNDTNTLYFWDGSDYLDLGGPFVGPQGPQGDAGINGENGSNGLDGDDGDGWYGTEIITDNDEYKIKFLSTEAYLEFTTDNLKGEPGALQVASETNIGGIKIGRGLSIDESGTAMTGTADVAIETIPLPGSYTQTFQPIYLSIGEYKEKVSSSYTSQSNWVDWFEGDIEMPPNSTQAALYWFAGSLLDITPSTNGFSAPNGQDGTFRAFLQNDLKVVGGVFSSGSDLARVTTNLNISQEYYMRSDGTTTMDGRGCTDQLCKFDVISFPSGGTLGFNWKINVLEMSRGRIASGGLRLMILPFQAGEMEGFRTLANTYAGPELDDVLEPPTERQLKDMNGGNLHQRVNAAIVYIDSLLLTYTDPVDQVVLSGYRTELINLINLPGTYDDVDTALAAILNASNNAYGQGIYRFQDA